MVKRKRIHCGYSVHPDQVNRVLSSQGGMCDICKCSLSYNDSRIDHNHDTGALRELLCHHYTRVNMHRFASKQSKSKQASVEHERTAPKEGLEKDGQAIRGPSQGPGLTPTPHIKGPTVCEQLSPSDIALQKYFDDYNMAHPGYYPNVYEKDSFLAGYNTKKPIVCTQFSEQSVLIINSVLDIIAAYQNSSVTATVAVERIRGAVFEECNGLKYWFGGLTLGAMPPVEMSSKP